MSARLLSVALALVGLAGCTEYEMATGPSDTGVAPVAAEDVSGLLRIDVHPPGSAMDADGRVTLLPRTFRIDADETGLDLVLPAPVTLEGTVSAWEVTPWYAADLPGARGPVPARVSVRKKDTVQGRHATADADGAYAVQVVPDLGYQVTFVTDDPEIPFVTVPSSIGSDRVLDVDLGYGAAVWGQVLDDAGAPLSGVAVHAVDPSGVAGADAITDADGWYSLRVLPGSYRLVAAGRDNGRDPAVETPSFEVPPEGASHDIAYGSLELLSVGGRVVGAAGGLGGAVVQFTAVSLDGYDDVRVHHDVRVETTSQGTFDTRLVPGTYAVEVRPTDAQPFSPLRLDAVEIRSSTDLGALTLAPLREITGEVLDDRGQPVPGAQVRADEIGFGERIWTTTADAEGRFVASLPQTPLRFTLSPPTSRADLAMTVVEAPPLQDGLALSMLRGERLQGTVRYEEPGTGATPPLPFAVVEVRDAQGALWGLAVTDARGDFELRVAWTP